MAAGSAFMGAFDDAWADADAAAEEQGGAGSKVRPDGYRSPRHRMPFASIYEDPARHIAECLLFLEEQGSKMLWPKSTSGRCSTRERKPFDTRNEGSKCVG